MPLAASRSVERRIHSIFGANVATVYSCLEGCNPICITSSRSDLLQAEEVRELVAGKHFA
ncbi:hypothetical protein PHLCEN_2v3914 [Hermanssonia centrifuga]|uniref:Uncharacterized protein n=1 Tax=Hermanssonia centrifuga TaxID=98765 RepID=A0A2R6QBD2_9APHY|nr:hypothetical protein PHLCEN_2v3914 [Hermanssonia centrifuga]